MTAPFVYDGAMNGTAFLAYGEQLRWLARP